jgi:lipopolysaccharide/colanic/teichoic acid biosynthesis glycosyltransferase
MNTKHMRYAILPADLLWMLGALALGIDARYSSGSGPLQFTAHLQPYAYVLFAAVAAWTFLYFRMALDGFQGGWRPFAMLSQIIVAVSLWMTLLLALSFLARHYYSRLVLLYFALFYFLGLVGLRLILHLLVTSRLGNPVEDRTVILGDGPVASELAAKIAAHPELPFHIVGFLFPAESDAFREFTQSADASAPASFQTLQVRDVLVAQKIRKLIIAMPEPQGAEIRKLISECRRSSIRVHLVPPRYDLYLTKVELLDIDGLPLLSLDPRNPLAAGMALKRVMDVLVGSLILILVSPILALGALAVYVDKGRALRTEARCGQGGIIFAMYRLNVDRRAARLRPYERILLRWSVTELPQLWNVLKGQMSLVGPRPETPERVQSYSDWQQQRLKVPAGVTGLAQVHGLREQHSSEDKAHYDLQYIFHWHPLLDLSLMVQTVWTLLFRGLTQDRAAPQSAKAPPSANDMVVSEVADVNRS